MNKTTIKKNPKKRFVILGRAVLPYLSYKIDTPIFFNGYIFRDMYGRDVSHLV